MSAGFEAAAFAVGGALGASAIAAYVTVSVSASDRRHQTQMYWLAARQQALSSLTETAGIFLRTAQVAHAGHLQALDESDLLGQRAAHVDAANAFGEAIERARFFTTNNDLSDSVERLVAARKDVSRWLHQDTAGKIRSTSSRTPITASPKAGFDAFRLARSGFTAAAIRHLGIDTVDDG